MKRIISILAMLGTMGYAASASAIGTAASTQIDNTANATFVINNVKVTEFSDKVTFFVDEILDVVVTGDITELVGTDGVDDTDQVVTFTVKNTGNGQEDFLIDVNLAVAGDDFDPLLPASVTLVYIDVNNDGLLDALDVPLSGNTLPLDADETVQLLVVTDMPAALASGQTAEVELTATSTTKITQGLAADPTGTIYENDGTNSVDAIVGTTTAVATATDTYLVNQLLIDLLKEAEKVAGFGDLGLVDGNTVVQVPGDTIRYRLTFTVSGDGALDNPFISDAIPTDPNTGLTVVDYIVGSIRITTDGGVTVITPTDQNDPDSAFKGPIPASVLPVGHPDIGKEGIVVDVEKLFSPVATAGLIATTTPVQSFEIVVEFDVLIPLN